MSNISNPDTPHERLIRGLTTGLQPVKPLPPALARVSA